MAKKQTDRLRVEKIRGQGPKEIFGENASLVCSLRLRMPILRSPDPSVSLTFFLKY